MFRLEKNDNLHKLLQCPSLELLAWSDQDACLGAGSIFHAKQEIGGHIEVPSSKVAYPQPLNSQLV